MRTDIESLSWIGGGSYKDLVVECASYADSGGLAVRLNSDEGVVTIVSVNLDMTGYAANPGCFWIKNYSEHEGLGDALIKAGVVFPTDRGTAHFGPFDATANEYHFTPEYDQFSIIEEEMA